MARAGFGGYQSYTVQKKRKELFFRVLRFLIIFYLLYLFIDGVFLRPYQVETNSMGPGIKADDRVVTLPFAYEPRLPLIPWALPAVRSPQRGDVVVITPPYREPDFPPAVFLRDLVRVFTLNQVLLFEPEQEWQNRETVRRLIGLPGDTVVLRDGTAFVKVKDEEFFLTEFERTERVYYLDKPALPDNWLPDDPFSGQSAEIVLGEGEYWVLADNRAGEDSRVWGPLQRHHLKSLVWVTLWPLDRIQFH